MAQDSKVCAKCGGVMYPGVHFTAGWGPVLFGLNLTTPLLRWTMLAKKMIYRGKEVRDVVSFACANCGYLESYLEKK